MRKFKKGDIVRISETSDYYKIDDDSNPIDCNGEIIHITLKGTHCVKWRNGIRNSYGEKDLILVSEIRINKIKNLLLLK